MVIAFNLNPILANLRTVGKINPTLCYPATKKTGQKTNLSIPLVTLTGYHHLATPKGFDLARSIPRAHKSSIKRNQAGG